MRTPDDMNDQERGKLDEIHSDVRQTRTRIEVIDERTRSMNSRMNTMEEDIKLNSNDIDKLEDTASRNSTILGGFLTGASALLLWISDKLTKFV